MYEEKPHAYEVIPIDRRRWEEPDAPHNRVIAIIVHGETLIYHVPNTAFESTCIE